MTFPFPADADRLLATLRNGAWLDAQEFPPLSYAVPGLIPEGSVLLVGAPKIGKSWLVLAVGLAASEGGKALGIEIPKRPVLYAALEDGDRRLQDRCRRLLVGDKIPPEFQYLTRIEPGRVGDTIATWLQWNQQPPPLVILDTLGKVLPPAMPNETTYQRDYRVGTALKRIVDTYPGATLLVNHHQRKASAEDFVDAVSGTAGLAGAADTIIVLSRDRQEASGLLKVTGRDVAEGEYAVSFKDGAVWELEGHDLEVAREKAQKVRATTRATAAAGDRMLDVVLYAYEHPQGVRRGDVAKALKLEPSVAGVYLARAVESGRLQRAERGLYTPVTSVTSLRSGPEDVTDNTRNTPPGGQRGCQPGGGRRPGTAALPRRRRLRAREVRPMMTATTLKPGTIVGDTSFHDPARRIRFGVVLAPEPSERVRRIISDDPTIWRPAVEEVVREALGRERAHG